MRSAKTIYKYTILALFCAGLGACGVESDAPETEDDSGAGDGDADGMGGTGEPAVEALPTCPDSPQGFATEVVAHQFGEGQDFGREEFPEIVLGGPQGGGLQAGSLHVTSLGDGGNVTLGFAPRVIVDGEGADFIVFENSFYAGGDPQSPVAELGRVAVSTDGEEWHEFPCDPGAGLPYDGCSGWTPVEASVIVGEGTTPFDPELAGGEAFDLAELGLDEARFVRITDVAGDDFIFDLDAVAIVHGRCE